MGKERLSHLEGRTSCHLSARLGSLGQSPHGPLPAPLEKHVHWGMHRGETPVGAGTLPWPRGGPAMAARSLPTSAQVSFWFKDKQTARVSCGHPLWTVQPPTASAVLGTTTLSPAPPDDPGASSPVPWSRRTDAVSHGPLLQSPLHSALCLVLCRESGRPSRRSLAPFLALWTETA